MSTEKLHKVMARTGIASRRASEILIDRGRVTVDGRPAEVGMRVDAETAHIEVDGVPLPVRPGLVHYLLHKPTGVVSTVDDPQGRATVVDLVPDDPAVHPVGRLDRDSAGLLVLTNDGDLTHLLTHPRHGVTKTYRALVEGRVTDRVIRALVDGVVLEDGPAAALSGRIIDVHGERSLVEVVMGEGRNREVRRMFDAVGHPVLELFRTAIGPVHDAGLRAGEWRHLTLDEVRALYEAAGQ